MSYEKKRYKGKCSLCDKKSYRKKLCITHYKADCKKKLHCTVLNCHRPIFANTLCRTHFKSFNTVCRISACRRHPTINNMCEYHYRRITLPPLLCEKCDKRVFIGIYCFLHYLCEIPALRQCSVSNCTKQIIARGMCKKHYVSWRRSEAKE